MKFKATGKFKPPPREIEYKLKYLFGSTGSEGEIILGKQINPVYVKYLENKIKELSKNK